MVDIEQISSEVEKLDPFAFSKSISDKGDSVLNAMAALTGDVDDARTMFMALVFSAAASDNKLDEKEFGLIKPFLEEAAEQELTYEEGVEFMTAFKADRNDFNKIIFALATLYKLMSEEQQTDVVTLFLLICASDGKISKREKNWLAKLIA